MTEQEMQALINEGGAIDAGAAAHAEAAATGQLDAKGNIMPLPNPADELAMKAQGWFIVPKTLAWAITTVFPETAPAYTDERCMELAKAIVPVADKYGWEGVEASPELMLLAATAMFGAPGFMAYRERKAAKAEAERKAREQGRQEGDDGRRE